MIKWIGILFPRIDSGRTKRLVGWLATIQAIEGWMATWRDMCEGKWLGDRIHWKLNKMRLLLGPVLGKMVRLPPFLYITPTVSFATLFEPILKMARPPNNWHSAFIIGGTCCQFDNKTILRRERLSSHCPASLLFCLSVTLTDNSWKPSLPPKLIMQVKFNHKRKGTSLFGCSGLILTSARRKPRSVVSAHGR